MKKNGFTILELMVALTIITGLMLTASPIYFQQQVPTEQVDDSFSEISEIKAAANGYYMENRSWPTSVNELITTGYLPSTGQSPFGSNYSLTPNGQNLVVSVDTGQSKLANMLVGKVPFGSLAGTVVSTEMGAPSREAIQSYFLARRPVPGCPNCNQLESGTDIDVNNNNLNNINDFDAVTGTIQTATITNATVDKLEVEEINLGLNKIDYVGTNLNINAGQVNINGAASINGALSLNNNNIDNVNKITAVNGEFTDLNASTGKIISIEGATLTYGSGVITDLSGNTLNYVTGQIENLSGNSLDYSSGQIDTLSGQTLNYTTGSIATLSGNSLSYSLGVINDLSGQTLNYTDITGVTGNFNSLVAYSASHTNLSTVTLSVSSTSYLNDVIAQYIDATSANITNLTSNSITAGSGDFTNINVSGKATINNLDVNTGSITNLNSTNAVINTASIDKLNVNDLTGVNATIISVNTNTLNTNFLTTQNFSADSVNVSGSFNVGGDITAQNVYVSNNTSTNNLIAQNSSLGVATANQLLVNGKVSASQASANAFSAGSGVIGTLSGNSASFSSITGNSFQGGSFYGSDFTTNQSSVNNNKNLIDAYKSQWQACLNADGCQ